MSKILRENFIRNELHALNDIRNLYPGTPGLMLSAYRKLLQLCENNGYDIDDFINSEMRLRTSRRRQND